MHEVWQWILNFTGVNNGDNSFGTHMYNFWSGFGGNISVLALIGALFGIYRHNLKRIERLNPVNIVKAPLKSITHRSKNKSDTK